MPLEFDRVSYSYQGDPSDGKRKRTRRESGAAADELPISSRPSSAYGSTADDWWALRDISFVLEDGAFLGLAGHTGSGKSTLIQHVNGLIHPTRGRVLVDGADLADKASSREARAKVGMVFQYPEYQLFAESVYDDVAFGPRNLKLPDREVELRVRQSLEAVGLSYRMLKDKSPFALSGGQQRRCALAGVLAMNPSILVLDEPASGLDPQAHAELIDLIAALNRQGITCIMASHNMDDLARLSSSILVLNEGSCFMLGTPAEVFAESARLHAIGLDVPFAQGVAEDLRSKGFPLPRALYGIEELADDIARAFSTEGGR